MPVITTSQEPDWNNNVYVIATTRGFVLIGTAYLVRSLYNLVSPTWGPRLASILARPVTTMSDLGEEQTNLNTLPTASVAEGPDSDLEANPTPSLQIPGRSYIPQGHMHRSQASLRAPEQHAETPGSSITANAILEQDVGVRHSPAHVEEDIGLDVELSG